jgi:Tfp pilus assembly protein PilZ
MSHNVTTYSENPYAPPFNDWRSERAPSNINFCKLPLRILVLTMHTHTLLYSSYTWTMLGTVFTNHTSSTTCAVFTYSWSAGLKVIIFMMDANPLLNSLHPIPTRMRSQYTITKHQWISRVEMFCLYKLSHHKVFCITMFPLSITWKPEEFQVTFYVAVVAPSGIACPVHSIGNIMKQKSNHAVGLRNNQ